jgi:ArsR family transcriptional regulator
MDREQFARIAKALADPRRFEILETIAAGEEVPCKSIVGSFPVSQATISHHLKELATAGLVEVRREGQCSHYRPRQDVIAEYLAETARRLAAAVPEEV